MMMAKVTILSRMKPLLTFACSQSRARARKWQKLRSHGEQFGKVFGGPIHQRIVTHVPASSSSSTR